MFTDRDCRTRNFIKIKNVLDINGLNRTQVQNHLKNKIRKYIKIHLLHNEVLKHYKGTYRQTKENIPCLDGKLHMAILLTHNSKNSGNICDFRDMNTIASSLITSRWFYQRALEAVNTDGQTHITYGFILLSRQSANIDIARTFHNESKFLTT